MLVLDNYVKKVFMDEKSRDDKFLSEDDVESLLAEDDSKYSVRNGIVGYPSHPLYKQISAMLQIWIDTGHCPVLDLPKYELLDEQDYVTSRDIIISDITKMLAGLKSLYSMWGEDEIKYRIRDILSRLGKRGLLDLLGIRKTVGTKDLWPPSRNQLYTSFCEPHSTKAELTVGARALAKHHHRDETESWWGTCTGSEKQKNEHALNVMNKVLDNATWINIHWLQRDVNVIEARVAEGYGLRWTADGKQFRGFLEPPMKDGHAVGWKH